MVWPMRLRRRHRKHAFEQALDDVRLDQDGEPISFDDPSGGRAGAPWSVASLGDITVASGYVAQALLNRAYGDGDRDADSDSNDETEAARPPEVAPGEAALKLKGMLHANTLTPRELTRLRRKFAADHHPDRVPQDRREEAVQAMAEVNAAIDLALKRARGR